MCYILNLCQFSSPSIVPENSSAPLVDTTLNSINQVILEGGSLTISFSVQATPEVVLPDGIRWLFEPFGSNSPVDITSTSMLGDGSTQLEFSADLLSLTLTGVSVNAAGLYYIEASNIAGTGTNITRVTVYSKSICLANTNSC